MADRAQLDILKRGVEVWNNWRKSNSETIPNFSRADLRTAVLRGAHLHSADLSGANLSGADLSVADLSKADLSKAYLSKANLSVADLSQADLRGANLMRTDLSRVDLGKADLRETFLQLANLSEADLRKADLREAHLHRADLRGANLGRANLSHASLNGARLSEVDLRGANLSKANLNQASLNGARLNGADLRGANLSSADLARVDLRKADLTEVLLHMTNLSEANLDEANLIGSAMSQTLLGAIDLSGVKGLETVRHQRPSTIGIDTFYLSKGEIPEVFMRGAGVPENFIAYVRSLVVKPIDYYSCFLSHSSRDKEFAKRLHADLQSEQVRCWYAPEDLRIGDKFRQRIDEAIQVYDKLLLVLSENSVNSPWVETEVETAFEKERQRKRLVLFPIRLDNAVMETREAWAADIRRQRHIGNFSQWKDHDSYKTALARLLRDLNSEDGTALPPKAETVD